jgi:hypothetical protein
VIERDAPHLVAGALVEEVLELQRAGALGRVVGVQRRLGLPALELRDDARRVADRLAVEL